MSLAANALTTYARYAELVGNEAPKKKQALIERVINAVSSAFIREAGGLLFHHREAISVDVGSPGGPNLILPDIQISSVTSASYIGAINGGISTTISTAELRIQREAGMLWRQAGWFTTAPLSGGVELRPLYGDEGPLWRIVYNAGFRTPKQAGTTFTDTVVDLPEDVELAVIMSVTRIMKKLGNDMAIESQSTNDQTVNYMGISELNKPNLLLPHTRQVAKSYLRPVGF